MLSMMTGSLRYMAPEIAKGIAYNQRCDVYSFSVLLWEMLTLQRPYDDFRDSDILMKKVFELNQRPKIPKKFNPSLKEILNKGWEDDQSKRSEMSEIRAKLRAELEKLNDKHEAVTSREHPLRRSSHVYPFADQKYPLIRMKALPFDISELLEGLEEPEEAEAKSAQFTDASTELLQ